MKEKKTTEVFSMSFLDIMACGFGALVLILLISEICIHKHAKYSPCPFVSYFGVEVRSYKRG